MPLNKPNLAYKLDHAEYQYHLLNNTVADFHPRLGATAKYYNPQGKKAAQRVEKLLAGLTVDGLSQQVAALKAELLDHKVHHVESKLNHLLVKQLENQVTVLRKNPKKDEQRKSKLQVVEGVQREPGFEQFVRLIVRSKVIKIVLGKVCPTKALKDDPPAWFQNHRILQQFVSKEDECNPSRVWKEVVQAVKGGEQLVSQLLSTKAARDLLAALEAGVDLALGTKKEKRQTAETAEKTASVDQPAEGEEDESSSSSNSSSDNEDSADSEDESSDDDDVSSQSPVDEDALVSQYAGMLAASDEEDDDPEGYHLDPNVDYNEVTDEEPDHSGDEAALSDDAASSDEDSSSEPPSKKQRTSKTKVQLPALMAGYYSGGDDSDLEDDEPVGKEQLLEQPKRKNRRGQRARQKIWEKKYGRNAKHVQRQFEKEREERARKQREYEERAAKRAAKEAEHARTRPASSHSTIRAAEPGAANSVAKPVAQELHPSWEAKKLSQEKQKAAKFQGKKIVFD
ncbi:AaceriABR052Wp [[Ashbya] aceris (nom. inval.)]|nr:AaceriABR052Wp [[Ashbya] aceris (nom. inval.)]